MMSVKKSKIPTLPLSFTFTNIRFWSAPSPSLSPHPISCNIKDVHDWTTNNPHFPHKLQQCQWDQFNYKISFYFDKVRSICKSHKYIKLGEKQTQVTGTYFHERHSYLLYLQHITKIKLVSRKQCNIQKYEKCKKVCTYHGKKEIFLLYMWMSTRVSNP